MEVNRTRGSRGPSMEIRTKLKIETIRTGRSKVSGPNRLIYFGKEHPPHTTEIMVVQTAGGARS